MSSISGTSNTTTTKNHSASAAWSTKTKQSSMHEFIRAVREYHKNRADELVAKINRHLQLLGVSIDTSIFDPNTSVVCEFLVSMYELLSFIEPRSSLSWGCVNVLQTACKNQAARQQLIHIYQFIPLLSRMLGDHLPLDKQIRLLTVIQELSCGVKISWIIPNLEHLMSTLLRWAQLENVNEQVLLLSLGIIINLCFKNLPSTYMLSKCVDINQFSKFVLKLKGVRLEACACKLFIILDYMYGTVSDSTFIKLLKVTFMSVKDSFITKDSILLRQNIEFYLDVKVVSTNMARLIVDNLSDYPERVEDILTTVHKEVNKTGPRAAGDCPNYDPECMGLIFKFLKSILDLKLPNLENYYEIMTSIALNWIQTELVASDALSFLKSIVISSAQFSAEPNIVIMENILSVIPILMLNLKNINNDTIITIDQCMRLSNIMELLKILVRTRQTRDRIKGYLTQDALSKVFNLAIGSANVSHASPQNAHAERANDANNFTPEAFALYINTLSLINVVTQFWPDWRDYLDSILKHQQIHAILADSLYAGSKEIRALVLDITAGSPSLLCEAVAISMNDLCKNSPTSQSSSRSVDNNMMSYSLISSCSSAPNEAIKILNEARSAQRINISACDVMELYEYKIATMGHAERAAMASVEAASSQCTHLQQQVAQLTAELSRIKQLFLHTQHIQKEAEGNIKELEADIRNLRIEKSLRQKVQVELGQLKEELVKNAKQIEGLFNIKEELEKEKENTMNKVIPHLKESLTRLEKLNESKSENIKVLQFDLQGTTTRLRETEVVLKNTEAELAERSQELEDALQDANKNRQLIDSIVNLAHSNK